MPTRTILKERESKPLIEELKRVPSLQQLSVKSRVELERIRDSEVIFVEGEPLAFRRRGEVVPVLVNAAALARLPRIVVDMGAVPHVCGGADIMAPGIRKVLGEFSANQLLAVVDEKHGKYLAIGKALQDSSALVAMKRGKVVENVHYVGDPIWESIKALGRGSAAPASG